MYIYVDVLIVTSVYIDYLVIKAAAALLHRRPPNRRCIIGAAAGSLFSLSVLLPPMGTAVSVLYRAVTAAVIVLIVFGFGDVRRFLCTAGTFLAVSCLFAGICLLISQTAGGMMLCRNGGVYINVPLVLLICSTAAAYGIAVLIRRFSVGDCSDGRYIVTVRARCVSTGETVTAEIPASADTGNHLADPVTGAPVIVCPADMLLKIADASDIGSLPRGWRAIPFGTACGSGIMPIFRPESISIRTEDGREDTVCTDAYIGVSADRMEYAVFNPKIFF